MKNLKLIMASVAALMGAGVGCNAVQDCANKLVADYGFSDERAPVVCSTIAEIYEEHHSILYVKLRNALNMQEECKKSANLTSQKERRYCIIGVTALAYDMSVENVKALIEYQNSRSSRGVR